MVGERWPDMTHAIDPLLSDPSRSCGVESMANALGEDGEALAENAVLWSRSAPLSAVRRGRRRRNQRHGSQRATHDHSE